MKQKLSRGLGAISVVTILAVGLGIPAIAAVVSYGAQTTNDRWTMTPAVKSMAAEIVASGRMHSDFATKILTAYSNGEAIRYIKGAEIRPCHIDGRFVAGIYQLTVVKKHEIWVSSTNRWCDWTGTTSNPNAFANSYSMHWAYGGGTGIDISGYRLNGGAFVDIGTVGADSSLCETTAYSSSARVDEIDGLITEFLAGASATPSDNWQIGQEQWRGSRGVNWDIEYYEFNDSCDHIHIAYAGTDRTYPKSTTCDFCDGFQSIIYSWGIPLGGTATTTTTLLTSTTPYYGQTTTTTQATTTTSLYIPTTTTTQATTTTTSLYIPTTTTTRATTTTTTRAITTTTPYYGQTTTTTTLYIPTTTTRVTTTTSLYIPTTTTTRATTTTTTVPAFVQLTIGTSGTWWGVTHWKRLEQAIGIASPTGSNFGRDPAFEAYGSYSARAVTFQQYLNANDGGKTSDIPVDGYWGPQTTEKLRGVLDYKCGTKLGVYGAIDGVGSGGLKFVFNQDEAAALAGCLNAAKF